MRVLLVPVRALKLVNDLALAVCRTVAAAGLAIMVVFILIQVFYRYVLNNALPWPDEAARFMMLWMTGLAAPVAYRVGGFVAIDMVERALPRGIGATLTLVLLAISLLVLVYAARIGSSEVTGFGGRFATASLYLPTSAGFDSWFRIPRSWMMASLLFGIGMLIVVNIELLLRQILILTGHEAELPLLPVTDLPEAE